MFGKNRNSLIAAHESAHAKGERALDVFRSLADDLHDAASLHADVAETAQSQIDDLRVLRDAADKAAGDKFTQSLKIRDLLG
jgi:hypothetical protein